MTEPAPASRTERWEWRARLRRSPARYRVYRAVIGVVGVLLVLVGLLLGPFPGPGGIPLVLAGLAVLASEFVWARRLLDRARRDATRFAHWAGRQPRWARAAASAGLLVVVACGVWAFVAVLGVPELVPDPVAELLLRLPGTER